MTDELSLSSDFPGADEAQWLAIVSKALKGGPVDKLTGRTESGLPVKPLYREPDFGSATGASGAPGAAPFTRGFTAARDAFLPWDIRQAVVHPDLVRAHTLVLEALEGGASSVEVSLAGATSADDVTKLLAEVLVDLAPIALDGARRFQSAQRLLEATTNVAGRRLALNLDPVSAFALTGATAALDRLPDAAKLAATLTGEDIRTFRIDAALIHEAGGDEVQELCYLAGALAETLRALLTAGVKPADAARTLILKLAAGPDILIELAKLRAARRIAARIADAFGADPSRLQIQSVTSHRMLAARDPWVNLLRNSAACFAAGTGGADIVTVRTFTDAMGLPGPLARRLARNTQVIAQEESALGKVIDPAGGAWTIETLADDMAKAAWTKFQSLESSGGIVAALKSGAFAADVAKSRDARLKAVAKRKEWITGVNDFPQIGELMPDIEGALPSSRASGPFAPIRLAEPFEALRTRGEAAGATVALHVLGPLAEHSARLAYAQNFFAVAGLKTETIQPGETSKATLACLCGADDRYATEAEPLARQLKQHGVTRLYLAGRPGEHQSAWNAAGIDEFIHVGVDIVETLDKALTSLG
jgi:methylmalonyl-CoA mutase